jgi:predicted dithiol-disulfide oxidoreductase (DUF899 family)
MIASLGFDPCISNLPIELAKDLDAFEGRRVLIAYYFMWHAGAGALRGCTWVTSQVRELSYIHSRDVQR